MAHARRAVTISDLQGQRILSITRIQCAEMINAQSLLELLNALKSVRHGHVLSAMKTVARYQELSERSIRRAKILQMQSTNSAR